MNQPTVFSDINNNILHFIFRINCFKLLRLCHFHLQFVITFLSLLDEIEKFLNFVAILDHLNSLCFFSNRRSKENNIFHAENLFHTFQVQCGNEKKRGNCCVPCQLFLLVSSIAEENVVGNVFEGTCLVPL